MSWPWAYFCYAYICPDVTLPSCLDGRPGSPETEIDRNLQRARQIPDSCRSSSSVLAKVYEEMMTICEQLKVRKQNNLNDGLLGKADGENEKRKK